MMKGQYELADFGDAGDLLAYQLRDGELRPAAEPVAVLNCRLLIGGRIISGLPGGGAGIVITDEMIRPFQMSAVEQAERDAHRAIEAQWRQIEDQLVDVPWTRGVPGIDPLTYKRPPRTKAQIRFLIVCAILAALWLAAAIIYIAGVSTIR